MYEPDYSFYTDVYKGTLGEDAFDRHLPQALGRVANLIGYNVVTDRTAEAYGKAVCAAVDAISAYGSEAVGGFSIGGFSMSAQGVTGCDIADASAAEYLVGTGLLFGGL